MQVDETPVPDRVAESTARLVLSLVPYVGPILAEAVGFTRTVYDDAQATAWQGEVKRRLGALEKVSDTGLTRVTGDRARILELLVRRAGDDLMRRVSIQEIMETLRLSVDECRAAIKELTDLGVIVADLNGNSAIGYERAAVQPTIYVELIGRFEPSIDVARELGLMLRVFEGAGEGQRARREAFEQLGIPLRRVQLFADYLEEQGLAEFHAPGFGDLLFLDAELTSHGWRVLRGDAHWRASRRACLP
jgi:predicted DNA-binding transcriptional regulator